jgi:D-alanine-D-alanine ligase
MRKETAITVAVLMGGVSSVRKAGFKVIEAVVDTPDLAALEGKSVDAVFIALHGAFGEDGRLQKLLEDAGFAYTGCGPEASANAMDKIVSKRKFAEADVPTAPYAVLTSAPSAADAAAVFGRFGPRVVVKPAAQGSSIGVSIVERGGFAEAVKQALSFDGRAIIEPFIKGRELTVGILGDRALPIVELKPHRQFFDYTAKYQYGQTDYIVNPELPDDIAAEVSRAGLEAFRCLGCRDLGRVDVMVSERGDIFVLEVNTIPGFTETSLVPMAASAAGMDFAALCRRIVEMALRRSAAARAV